MAEGSNIVQVIEDVAPARHALVDHLRASGADPDQIDVVAVVASELLANAVIHARSAATLRLEVTDASILVAVADEDPRPPDVQAREAERVGGHGLRIVEALADEWGSSRGPGHGKEVWARFER